MAAKGIRIFRATPLSILAPLSSLSAARDFPRLFPTFCHMSFGRLPAMGAGAWLAVPISHCSSEGLFISLAVERVLCLSAPFRPSRWSWHQAHQAWPVESQGSSGREPQRLVSISMSCLLFRARHFSIASDFQTLW